MRKFSRTSDGAGLKSARKNGRIGSRLTLMTDERIRAAQSMLKNPIGSFVPLWDLTQNTITPIISGVMAEIGLIT